MVLILTYIPKLIQTNPVYIVLQLKFYIFNIMIYLACYQACRPRGCRGAMAPQILAEQLTKKCSL